MVTARTSRITERKYGGRGDRRESRLFCAARRLRNRGIGAKGQGLPIVYSSGPVGQLAPAPTMTPFQFLLIRPEPAMSLPGIPLGLVYRSRFAGEHHWNLSIRWEAVALVRVAVCLGMLYVDQALGVLQPTTDPPGPGVAVFGADGVWRDRGGGIIDEAVQAEVARVAAVLIEAHLDYVWGVAGALKGELSEGFVDVPPEHPSYDAGLEQVFAPAPPSVAVRS